MIKAVIFDMDGLLVDTEGHWQECERKLFGELGIEITDEMLLQTKGLRSDAQIRHWYAYQPWEERDDKALEDRYYAMMEDYFRSELTLMPGAREAIEFFAQKGLPMALASSSRWSLIHAFVDRFELGDVFTSLHSAENLVHAKPHPEIYLDTAEELGVKPENCLALEDSFPGMLAALSARMKVFAVPDHREERFLAATKVLKSLKEVNDELYEEVNKL